MVRQRVTAGLVIVWGGVLICNCGSRSCRTGAAELLVLAALASGLVSAARSM
eukprot:COSAG06_NODE_19054_length_855_cov_2.828042_3_plen_51_part_01